MTYFIYDEIPYTQHVSVDKEASIFSIGGSCISSLTSVASQAFVPHFSSCNFQTFVNGVVHNYLRLHLLTIPILREGGLRNDQKCNFYKCYRKWLDMGLQNYDRNYHR